jgi:hypothetical protein
MWSNFKNILLNAMGKHVPSKLTSSRPTYPWITTAVRRGINRKIKAGRKARKTKKPKDRERYRKLKAQAQRTSRQAYSNYVHDIINPDMAFNKMFLKLDHMSSIELKVDNMNLSVWCFTTLLICHGKTCSIQAD